MPQNASNVKPENELSFEESMNRLEVLVTRMEHADVPLEELLQAVEEARLLADRCQKMLDSLDGKVQLLTGGKVEGSGEWREFDGTVNAENFIPAQEKDHPFPAPEMSASGDFPDESAEPAKKRRTAAKKTSPAFPDVEPPSAVSEPGDDLL